jgi:hypothetical protein
MEHDICTRTADLRSNAEAVLNFAAPLTAAFWHIGLPTVYIRSAILTRKAWLGHVVLDDNRRRLGAAHQGNR